MAVRIEASRLSADAYAASRPPPCRGGALISRAVPLVDEGRPVGRECSSVSDVLSAPAADEPARSIRKAGASCACVVDDVAAESVRTARGPFVAAVVAATDGNMLSKDGCAAVLWTAGGFEPR